MTYNVFSGTLNPAQYRQSASSNNEGRKRLMLLGYTTTTTAAAADVARENWGLHPVFGKRVWLGLHLTQSPLAEAYLHTKWHLDAPSLLVTIEMGRKVGRGSAPSLGRGAGSPSSTMWPGRRPTSMPSAILIHLAV